MQTSAAPLNAEAWRPINRQLHEHGRSAEDNGSEAWTTTEDGMLLARQFALAGMTALAAQVEAFVDAAAREGFNGYAEAIANARYIKERAALPIRRDPPTPVAPTWEEELISMGMPAEFARFDPRGFDVHRQDDVDFEAFENARYYQIGVDAGAGDGCMIASAVRGNGKTTLASILARKILKHQRTTSPRARLVWVSAPDLLADLRDAERRQTGDDVSELVRVNDLQRAALVVIDDLGQGGRTSAFVQEQLFRIIDYRYSNALPTIVTTNLIGADVREHVGESVADRLRTFAFVQLKGKGQRQRPMRAAA